MRFFGRYAIFIFGVFLSFGPVLSCSFGLVLCGLVCAAWACLGMRRYVCTGLDWSVAVACKVYCYHWNWGCVWETGLDLGFERTDEWVDGQSLFHGLGMSDVGCGLGW